MHGPKGYNIRHGPLLAYRESKTSPGPEVKCWWRTSNEDGKLHTSQKVFSTALKGFDACCLVLLLSARNDCMAGQGPSSAFAGSG